MLNTDLADLAQIAGEGYARTSAGREGFAVFGPYDEVSPGRYSIEFAIGLADDSDCKASTICARLDIAANDGRTLYNRRELSHAELASSPTTFTLNFDSTKRVVLEYRVWTTGAASLLVRVRRVLSERAHDSAAAARWFPNHERRPNPMVLIDHLDDFQALYRRGSEVRFLTDEMLEVRLGDQAFQVRNYNDLVACANTLWPAATGAAHHGIPDYWEKRALVARDRRERFAKFGAMAIGLVARSRHGLFVVDSEDSAVGASLLDAGSYGDFELEWSRAFLEADYDALVVGTHIGALVVPISRTCRSVIGIEANPHTFDLLQMNLLLNRCDNVTVHNIAAGEVSSRLAFLANRDNSGGSKIMPFSRETYYIYDDPEVIEVEGHPLDEFLQDKTFDFILMDIEGSEYFALKGMPRLLLAATTLVIEFIPHHLSQVANVTIDQFLGVITPFFDMIVVPATGAVFPADRIASELRRMYMAGEQSDGLYFLKQRAIERMDPSLRARLRPAA